MSLYKTQTKNIYKTYLLMSVFLVIVILIGWMFAIYFQNPALLYIFVVVAIGVNIYSYWNSDKIAIKLTKAKPVTRKEYFDCYTILENLSIQEGIQSPKLYVIDDESPNAFATGRNPSNSAVVVTKGLLNKLNKNELEGVIAHELAHILNRDTLLMTVVVVLIGLMTIILDFMIRMTMFGRDRNAILIIAIVVIAILTPIVLSMLKMAISRKREYLADATAAIYTRYPEGLASALEKISKDPRPLKNANTATAHLFISDPFHITEKKNIFSKFHHLFDTHPPIEKRVRALREHS